MKLCPDCGFERPREDFIYGGKVRSRCRRHWREFTRQYIARNRERVNRYHRDRNARNPEEHRQRQKDLVSRYRLQVLEHYGGTPPRCECCGESSIEFLVLDHRDGGGEKHRKEFTKGLAGLNTYRWAVKNDFPPIFRVLCHNCNSSYGHYGYCPHQKKH